MSKEILNAEIPLCTVCETPIEGGATDRDLGLLCYECRAAAALAEVALAAVGIPSPPAHHKKHPNP